MIFTATVKCRAQSGKRIPTGSVQFILDGSRVGEMVKLNSMGRASWIGKNLKPGAHQLVAQYLPSKGSAFLASSSIDKMLTVKE